jgi:hypothetical protein
MDSLFSFLLVVEVSGSTARERKAVSKVLIWITISLGRFRRADFFARG